MALNLALYPNPVRDVLHINASNSRIIDEVMVYNVLGQLVKSEQNNVKTIDFSDLRSGSYLVTIHTENEVLTKKVFKN